jgi:hypothetical protein
VTWPALFGVFLLSHLAGDFLFQTEWQATHKHSRPLATPESRRALCMHALTYILAFVPSLVWVGTRSGAPTAVGIAALVVVPHLIIDDGRLVAGWVRRVKHVHGVPTTVVRLGVDQSLHMFTLAGVALLVTG